MRIAMAVTERARELAEFMPQNYLRDGAAQRQDCHLLIRPKIRMMNYFTSEYCVSRANVLSAHKLGFLFPHFGGLSSEIVPKTLQPIAAKEKA
jgi:hypothetical protein